MSSLLQKINNTFLNAVLFNWRIRGDFLLSAVVEVLEEGWSEIHGAEETPREFIAWKNRQPNVNTLVHVTRIIQVSPENVLRRVFVSAGR